MNPGNHDSTLLAPGKIYYSILFLVFFLLSGVSTMAIQGSNSSRTAKNFYYSPGKDIGELTSWNSQADGSGASPARFDSDSTRWNIITDAVVIGNITISGKGSKVVVRGNDMQAATLTLVPGSRLNALVDVEEMGKINIMTNDYPTIGQLHPGSTVAFMLGNKTIPYLDYFNLTLVSCTPEFKEANDKTLKIRGDLNLVENVVFPPSRNNVEYNILFHGPWSQQVLTNGNTLRAFNITFDKSEGLVRLQQEGILSADNRLSLKFSGDVVFDDFGATLYAGQDILLAGNASNFSLKGTLIMAGEEPALINGNMAGGKNEIIFEKGTESIVALNNLVISSGNRNGEVVIKSRGNQPIEIKNNLTLKSTANTKINFTGTPVMVGGELIIEDGFAGTITGRENIKKRTTTP